MTEPSKPLGRPRSLGPKPQRVVAYIPPKYLDDLKAMARVANRAVAYTAAEILKRAVDEYRLARAAELAKQGLIPEPAAADDSYELRDPTERESPAEIIQQNLDAQARGKL
jgi:hypothetical protein